MSVIDSNHSSASSSLGARETVPQEGNLPDVGPTLRSFGRWRLLRLLDKSTRRLARSLGRQLTRGRAPSPRQSDEPDLGTGCAG